MLPIHFFTVAYNCKPFLERQIATLKQLPFAWTWHIVEGKVDQGGLSTDGTTEYINELSETITGQNRVWTYRTRQTWEGKQDMLNVLLPFVREECLLWYINVGEYWSTENIVKTADRLLDKTKIAGAFWCIDKSRDELIEQRKPSAKREEAALRVWHYHPNMAWAIDDRPYTFNLGEHYVTRNEMLKLGVSLELHETVGKRFSSPPKLKLHPAIISRQSVDGTMGKIAFNPSMCKFNGKTYFSYRLDERYSKAVIGELDNYEVKGSRVVDFGKVIGSQYVAFEDVRLFSFRARLFCSFTTYDSYAENSLISMAYAEIDPGTLTAIRGKVFKYSRGLREKNWQFFEHENELYCAYSIDPHEILRIDVDTGKITELYDTPSETNWEFGIMRGGTPPVRIGDQYWSFFHSSISYGDEIQYFAGVYSFEAKPPFRMIAHSKTPLLSPQERKGEKPVVFPCGALYEDGLWTISYGVNDRRCRIATIDHAAIDTTKPRKIHLAGLAEG